jgi:hypothetical protein
MKALDSAASTLIPYRWQNDSIRLFRASGTLEDALLNNSLDLPRFLDAFSGLNEGSLKALLLDSCNWFFRKLNCPSTSLKIVAADAIFKAFIIHVAQSETPQTVGVHIQLFAKDGKLDNTFLAVAFTPIENMSNMG